MVRGQYSKYCYFVVAYIPATMALLHAIISDESFARRHEKKVAKTRISLISVGLNSHFEYNTMGFWHD